MPPSRPQWPCLLAAGLLCGCGASSHSENSAVPLDPATAAYQEHGYSERPVEARLGPHRFRIPANYFRDQIGPDFQGNFSLLVQWPDLQPLPPGKRGGQDMATFDRQVTIAPRYIDRVPIEGRLEASTRPLAEPGTPEYEDPASRLDLMVEQPQRDGLTPYLVDTERLAAYDAAQAARLGVSVRRAPASVRDWFVRRDADGGIVTLIRCGREPAPGERLRPQCTHDITIPELKVAVSIDYARDYLSGWRAIEDRARELIAKYRID